MTTQQVSDFITYGAFGTLIGGRLGYVLFYDPSLITKFKAELPFWGVLAVNEGGMASHGGIIGIVIGAALYANKINISKLYLLDLVAVGGPLGVMFGRIANFINGELVGRPAPADLPWAVRFPQDIMQWPRSEFDRLRGLEDVVSAVGGEKEKWLTSIDTYRSDATAQDYVYAMLDRIVVEIQNGNAAAKQLIGPLLTPRHPSQLYAAFGEGLFIFLVLFFLWRKSRKPGFIAASFIILYAFVRISDEFFRMPDAEIGFQALGLTRGQWLSVVMIVIGFIAMFVWTRTSSLFINGWGRTQNIKVGRRK
jgi:phosphatidylglycerol---prolipoprotein diacylglyceryl transferase